MSGELCDDCHKRPGKVRFDELVGPFVLANGERVEPFRIVYRRCRWCEGANTKLTKRSRVSFWTDPRHK